MKYRESIVGFLGCVLIYLLIHVQQSWLIQGTQVHERGIVGSFLSSRRERLLLQPWIWFKQQSGGSPVVISVGFRVLERLVVSPLQCIEKTQEKLCLSTLFLLQCFRGMFEKYLISIQCPSQRKALKKHKRALPESRQWVWLEVHYNEQPHGVGTAMLLGTACSGENGSTWCVGVSCLHLSFS